MLVIANIVFPHDFDPVRAGPRLCHLPTRDREEFQVDRETLRLTAQRVVMPQEDTVGAQRSASLKPMRVMVRGRIKQIRLFGGTRYTRIVAPAPDAYSRPRVVEMHTKQKLGGKGDEMTVVCSLGGYQRKPYQLKNKNTGEMEAIMPVGHILDMVEA